MKLTHQYNELLRKPAIKRRNPDCGEAQSAQPEPAICHEPLETKKREGGNPIRAAVSICSYRRKLLDPDNLCPKYFIDGLRYAGVLFNDRQEDIQLQVSQVKVSTKEEERTEIRITQLADAKQEVK